VEDLVHEGAKDGLTLRHDLEGFVVARNMGGLVLLRPGHHRLLGEITIEEAGHLRGRADVERVAQNVGDEAITVLYSHAEFGCDLRPPLKINPDAELHGP
jgi:hypothetical protein